MPGGQIFIKTLLTSHFNSVIVRLSEMAGGAGVVLDAGVETAEAPLGFDAEDAGTQPAND
jgi:hypothetical protein